MKLFITFRMAWIAGGCALLTCLLHGQTQQTMSLGEAFILQGHAAFVLEPRPEERREGPMPWVWYAPTLKGKYPGKEEVWMIHAFHKAGIAMAGIDVGESHGSPEGREVYQQLYEELTSRRAYGKKPVLLARSRGGLMLYNWAAEHPASVGGVAGIYPVCNLLSYPGLERAAAAYAMSATDLKAVLPMHNPVQRLPSLAKARVPIYHLHGDKDLVVPLDVNSALLAREYKALGGPMELHVIPGQGHNLWKGWFQSQALTDFVIARALGEIVPQRGASEP